MLNVELGIPCDTASNYYNAAGFSRQMMEKAKAAAAQAAAAAEAEMNKTRQYIMRGFGNAILQANSAEALNAALDKLAQEKRNVGGGSFTGLVGVFGKTFMKGITPTTCPATDAECKRRTLAAIVEFEKNNRTTVEEKIKQFSTTNTQIKKQGSTLINRIREQIKKAEAEAKAKEAAEAEAKGKPMDYPPPMPPNTIPPIPPIPSISPTPMPSVEEQGATVGGGAEAGAGATDTPKDAVLIGGKEIKKSTLIFGVVGLGIVGLLYYKWR